MQALVRVHWPLCLLPKFTLLKLTSACYLEILSIEGQDPYAYVRQIANEYTGDFLDDEIRQSVVYSSYRYMGKWGQRIGGMRLFCNSSSCSWVSLLTYGLNRFRWTHCADLYQARDQCRSDSPWRARERDRYNVRGHSQCFCHSPPRYGTDPRRCIMRSPYVSTLIGKNFTDQASYWENNCAPGVRTNGVDYKLYMTPLTGNNTSNASFTLNDTATMLLNRRAYAGLPDLNVRKEAIDLPPAYIPSTLNLSGSDAVTYFTMLPDTSVGVMVIGSFAPLDPAAWQQTVLDGINGLKSQGAEHLIIDVTNNGGGYVCDGLWVSSSMTSLQVFL